MSWPMVRLDSICKLNNGRAYKKHELLEEKAKYPVLRVGNFFSNRGWYHSDLELGDKFYCDNGDLLYAWSASFGPKIWDGTKVIYHYHIWKIDLDESLVDKKYLYYALDRDVENIKREQGSGSTMIHVTKTSMEERLLQLPPLSEQKRIAAILDKADAIRRKRQQAIELADEFLRSVFLDMFGDPVVNPKRWEVKPISKLATITTGNTPPRSEAENYGEHIEWIKSDNINTPSHYLTRSKERLSEQGQKKARVVDEGSILMTCIAGSRDCIGNAALVDREVAFNQQINALTPKHNSTSEYLYSIALFSKRLIQGASTNSMKGMVSKGNLEKLLVPLPPIELQREYAILFQRYLTQRSRFNKALSNSDELFASLSQKAFSGNL